MLRNLFSLKNELAIFVCGLIFFVSMSLVDAGKPLPGLPVEQAAYSASLYPDDDDYANDLPFSRDERSKAKYSPSYKYVGLGKRDTDIGSTAPRPKYGKNYKWIGLGKRGEDSQRKYSPAYKYIGLGKRDAKFSKNYKWIGLGKRMAPYWSSQLLQNFKDIFGENENNKAGIQTSQTRGRFMRPVYSVVTKKLTPDAAAANDEAGTIFSDDDINTVQELHPQIVSGMQTNRPNVRGGGFEPIYVGRYVGLGR